MSCIDKWDARFLDLAKYNSRWSKDPSTQVGAVIIDKTNRIVSMGYNGLPQKIPDDPDILNNRDVKYDIIIHAEINALIFAKQSIEGCILYTYPFLPCSRCTSIFIQAGIAKIIAPKNKIERWEANLGLTRAMLDQAKIEYIEYDI